MTVKALATLSGVSVRTLHYYDEIDILKPDRTSSGYRVYGQDHILRLQQILIQKSLGLSLSSIKSSLDDPQFDNVRELQSQKQVLLDRMEHSQTMITAIDAAIAKSLHLEKETQMSIKEIFDGFDPEEYAAEAKEYWGNTESYKASLKRTKSYSQQDWKQIKRAEQSIWETAAKAMVSGLEPASLVAADLVKRHHHHIDHWFYETSDLGYASLADVWESDPRFTNNIDKYGEGLTQWFAAAVRSKYGAVV